MTYPTVGQGSKLGIHTIQQRSSVGFAADAANRDAPLSVFKAVDAHAYNPGIWASVKQLSPRTVALGRFVTSLESCGGVELPNSDLQAMANALVAAILARTDSVARRVVDYWEISNEPDPPDAAGYRRLGLLMNYCMDVAEQSGIKLALLALNAGTPEWSEAQALVDSGMFARAQRGGHILSCHEGVFGANDPVSLYWPGSIPGAPSVPGAGALCLRYRYLYSLLAAKQLVIPLVVSEFYGGGDRTNGDEQVRRMSWYDSEVRRDAYVLGFLPFTLGPTAGWEQSDYEQAYPKLVDYAVSVRDLSNAATQTSSESWLNFRARTRGWTNVRSIPQVLDSNILTVLPPGAVLPVQDDQGGWVRVSASPAGWMAKHVCDRV